MRCYDDLNLGDLFAVSSRLKLAATMASTWQQIQQQQQQQQATTSRRLPEPSMENDFLKALAAVGGRTADMDGIAAA